MTTQVTARFRCSTLGASTLQCQRVRSGHPQNKSRPRTPAAPVLGGGGRGSGRLWSARKKEGIKKEIQGPDHQDSSPCPRELKTSFSFIGAGGCLGCLAAAGAEQERPRESTNVSTQRVMLQQPLRPQRRRGARGPAQRRRTRAPERPRPRERRERRQAGWRERRQRREPARRPLAAGAQRRQPRAARRPAARRSSHIAGAPRPGVGKIQQRAARRIRGRAFGRRRHARRRRLRDARRHSIGAIGQRGVP